MNNEVKRWADEIWEKIDKKLFVAASNIGDKIPHSTDGNKYTTAESISAWTNGFWGGLMWLMYTGTKKNLYKDVAIRNENLLDGALENFDDLHHDVGFMWKLTSGVNYDLFKNEESRRRLVKVGNFLAARFNIDGGYIRSWNGNDARARQLTIIDCMMNIPLLYWMSIETGDDRYKKIAMRHADKTMQYHVRPDGSVNHIMRYDENTGEIVCIEGGQGFNENSSWTRGHAWGLYGFVLSYIHTGKEEYLDTAKRIAHYFISACCNDWLVRSDFRTPKEPVLYDSSAAAIAVCGLIELSEQVTQYEKELYFNAAINILKATEEKFADWSDDTVGILGYGSEWYNNGRHRKLIYGDYFFVEAICKLRKTTPLFW